MAHRVLAVRIAGPVSCIIFIAAWFGEITQRFSQGSGDLLQVGQIESSFAQLIVRQGRLGAA